MTPTRESLDPGLPSPTRMCVAAIEPCGCTASVFVVDGVMDATAYAEMAREAKKGCRIEHLPVAEWKARGFHCADHPKGPPWWKSNGGNGRRPAEYSPQVGLGL